VDYRLDWWTDKFSDPRLGLEIMGSFAWDGGVFTAQELQPAVSEPIMLEIPAEALEGAGMLEQCGGTSTSQRRLGADKGGGGGGQDGAFQLRDVKLVVRRGEMVGVYGRIGAGKSSLLSAILGEMYARRGSFVRLAPQTRVAYCGQSAWIQRGTVRSIITFGEGWDPHRYARAIEACALAPDLASMPQGDMTEVGERGATLSGGQKLRLALARAVYTRADLYLLDDPFSGLDPTTAAHVSRACLQGLMREEGATVILVTHSLPLLEDCDWLVCVEGGRIIRREKIIKRTDGAETKGASQGEGTGEQAKADTKPHEPPGAETRNTDVGAAGEGPAKAAQLMQDEDRVDGQVRWDVYTYYGSAVGGCLSASTLLSLLGMQLSSNAFSYWLSLWSSHVGRFSTFDFLEVSTGIAGVNSLFTFARSFLFAYGGLKAARHLHDTLLRNVLGASPLFFDTTPIGRCVLLAAAVEICAWVF
jgi:ABC-type multidrug transport system ATPase subunit